MATSAACGSVDGALLLRLKEADPSAMEELVRLYRRRIVRRALGYVRRHADAEDLAQEVLLRIVGHVGRLPDERALWPWIARITSNAAVSHLRAERRRSKRERCCGAWQLAGDARDASPEPVDENDLADALLHRGQVRRRLALALRTLPFVYRDAVVLRDVEGYSTEEVSQALGVPVPTVKSRVGRGRHLLRRALGALEGWGPAITTPARAYQRGGVLATSEEGPGCGTRDRHRETTTADSSPRRPVVLTPRSHPGVHVVWLSAASAGQPPQPGRSGPRASAPACDACEAGARPPSADAERDGLIRRPA